QDVDLDQMTRYSRNRQWTIGRRWAGGAPFAPPARPAAGAAYFFSKSPSRWDFNASTLSPVRSCSLAASPFTVHLKLNLRPTGITSAAFFFASSFPSNPVILALTSPSFATV